MSTPIDIVKHQIEALLITREEIYLQLADIETQLKVKRLMVNAFDVVSTNLEMYDAWKEQVAVTPPPDAQL